MPAPADSLAPVPRTPASRASGPWPAFPALSSAQPCRGNAWAACAQAFRTSGRPTIDVERLALLCGPRFGLVRSAQPWLGAAAADAPGVRTFEGLQHECVRVFAVTSAPMGILVRILSPQGEPVAGAASERTYLAAPQDGAYCLASSGQYTIELRTGGTNEPVAMQLWVLR